MLYSFTKFLQNECFIHIRVYSTSRIYLPSTDNKVVDNGIARWYNVMVMQEEAPMT